MSKKIVIKKSSKRDSNKVELDQLVLRTIVMRFTEKESLAYIKSNYKSIEANRYYAIKKELKNRMMEEGYKLTSKNGLYEQHMLRINTLETIEQEQWKKYHIEPKPFLQSAILERITSLQVYISSAYDYTRSIIQNQEDLQLSISKHGNLKLKNQVEKITN